MEITIPQTISQDSAARPDPSPEQAFDESALLGRRARVRPGWRDSGWLHGLIALAAVYLFIAAIEMMGGGLKIIATDPASRQHLDSIYAYTHNPFSALCIGILLTAIVQSSSFTTTFVVGLVAGGQISLANAIPVIMGANIGTSVTNLLVSLAHLRNRQEFRRSLAGAVVHDIFNVLTVLVVMPLELGFGILSRPAHAFADWLEGAAFFTTDPKKFNFVKMAIQPLGNAMKWLLRDVLNLSATWAGAVQSILSVLLLFVALYMLVKVLQGLLKERLAGLFSKTLFRNQGVSFFVGLFTTAAVQSSSVTTSLVVPLVGAGVLKVRQIFPYTLGANIGTTVTAILGALALAAIASGTTEAAMTAAAFALAVAFSHLLFNVYGTVVFWPLKFIPISLAQGYAKLAAERRILAAVYILVVFFIIPVGIIVLANWN